MPANYFLDPLTLREVVNDKKLVSERILELELKGETGDAERIAWLRMVGRLDEAEKLGRASLAKARVSNFAEESSHILPLPAVTAALRLAHVFHWQERHVLAKELFLSAITAAKDATKDPKIHRKTALSLVAFGQQHLGKLHFDLGEFSNALDCFNKALAIRHDLDSPSDQIESTLQAIQTTKSLIEGTATSPEGIGRPQLSR